MLVDDLKWHIKAYKQALEEAGIEISEEEVAGKIGPPTAKIIRKAIQDNGSRADYLQVTARKIDILREFLANRETFRKETEEIINLLKKNYLLGICSSGKREQMVAVPEGFLTKFDYIMTSTESEEFGLEGKPAPDTLLFVAKKLDANPAECTYIGDMPVDMTAGRAARMFTVGFSTEFFTPETLAKTGADKVINNLYGLIDLISGFDD